MNASLKEETLKRANLGHERICLRQVRLAYIPRTVCGCNSVVVLVSGKHERDNSTPGLAAREVCHRRRGRNCNSARRNCLHDRNNPLCLERNCVHARPVCICSGGKCLHATRNCANTGPICVYSSHTCLRARRSCVQASRSCVEVRRNCVRGFAGLQNGSHKCRKRLVTHYQA